MQLGCCAEQHSPPATCGGVVQPADFGLGRAACCGVASGSLQFCRAAQPSCSSLVQPQEFGVSRRLPWGGARHSPGCCRAAQEAFWGWCQAQYRLLQSSTGCHMLCPAQPTVQPGDFGLGREIFDEATGSLVLCRAAQATCHLWWPGAACRFRAWQGSLLWGGIRQLMLLQSSTAWLQQPGAASGIGS